MKRIFTIWIEHFFYALLYASIGALLMLSLSGGRVEAQTRFKASYKNGLYFRHNPNDTKGIASGRLELIGSASSTVFNITPTLSFVDTLGNRFIIGNAKEMGATVTYSDKGAITATSVEFPQVAKDFIPNATSLTGWSTGNPAYFSISETNFKVLRNKEDRTRSIFLENGDEYFITENWRSPSFQWGVMKLSQLWTRHEWLNDGKQYREKIYNGSYNWVGEPRFRGGTLWSDIAWDGWSKEATFFDPEYTYQEGISGYAGTVDFMIHENLVNTNAGSNALIGGGAYRMANTAGNIRPSIIVFKDINSDLADGIYSGTVELHIGEVSSAGGIEIYSGAAWVGDPNIVEMTGVWMNPVPEDAGSFWSTWNHSDRDQTNWTLGGVWNIGHQANELLGTESVSSTGALAPVGGLFVVSQGVCVVIAYSATSGFDGRVTSAESVTSGDRPKLTLIESVSFNVKDIQTQSFGDFKTINNSYALPFIFTDAVLGASVSSVDNSHISVTRSDIKSGSQVIDWITKTTTTSDGTAGVIFEVSTENYVADFTDHVTFSSFVSGIVDFDLSYSTLSGGSGGGGGTVGALLASQYYKSVGSMTGPAFPSLQRLAELIAEITPTLKADIDVVHTAVVASITDASAGIGAKADVNNTLIAGASASHDLKLVDLQLTQIAAGNIIPSSGIVVVGHGITRSDDGTVQAVLMGQSLSSDTPNVELFLLENGNVQRGAYPGSIAHSVFSGTNSTYYEHRFAVDLPSTTATYFMRGFCTNNSATWSISVMFGFNAEPTIDTESMATLAQIQAETRKLYLGTMGDPDVMWNSTEEIQQATPGIVSASSFYVPTGRYVGGHSVINGSTYGFVLHYISSASDSPSIRRTWTGINFLDWMADLGLSGSVERGTGTIE